MAKMMNQFKVSHPGEMIARELEEMGISEQEFIDKSGVSPAFFHGRQDVTPELAIGISKIAGSSPDYWLRLQNRYDSHRRADEFDEIMDTHGVVYTELSKH